MKIAAILSRKEVFTKQGGANSSKCYEIFRRFDHDKKIYVYANPTNRYAYTLTSNIVKRKILAAYLRGIPFLKRRIDLWCAWEISLRLRNTFDLIYIFNEPLFVQILKRSNPDSKIILHIGNDHLIENEHDETLCRDSVNMCHKIICISHYIRQGILTKYPQAASKTIVLHNGINIHRFFPVEKSLLSSTAPKCVLFVGRVIQEKGVHVLLQAMFPVFEKYPDVTLRIIGSKWYGVEQPTAYIASLQQMSHKYKDNVVFEGYVRNDLVADVYRQATIFVCPSLWNEPLGNVVGEAMASGLPVIASRAGGIPEWIGDAGILVDPGDIDEMTNKILFLLSNERQCQEYGLRARKRIEDHFNWDTVAPKFERLAEELVSE